jgi:hypothetical protein
MLLYCYFTYSREECDYMISGNPASRGTENVGRGSCRSARADGVERRSTAVVLLGDQVIRETPANRGTETSAEVLVGPPWRIVQG